MRRADGKKKNSINKVVVSSKEELKTAIKRKNPYIEVQGDLAKKMKWMGKLSSAKIAAIIALLTPLAAVPGGGVLTVTALTAGGVVEAAEANVVIYVISILGIATIIGIFRGYNVEVETIAVERIKEDKSLVDHKLVAGVSKAVYKDEVDSIILASSDSDFWSVIEDVDANYLVLLEKTKCGSDFKSLLWNNNILINL